MDHGLNVKHKTSGKKGVNLCVLKVGQEFLDLASKT